MNKSKNTYFIITTMSGEPVLHNDKIMQYTSTASMRQAAKHLTFNTGERHHTRGLTKDGRFRAKKHYDQHDFIPLHLLQ